MVKYADKINKLLEQDIYPLFAGFEHLSTNIGVDALVEYMTKYRLLPNDALIVATCRAYNIENIATFDEDFKRVPWAQSTYLTSGEETPIQGLPFVKQELFQVPSKFSMALLSMNED